MTGLKWLPEVLEDLQRLYEFIEPHSQSAALRAVDTLVAAAESLQAFPDKGRVWEEEPSFRELPVSFGAKGYVIRYRLYKDIVVIVRVWHTLEDR